MPFGNLAGRLCDTTKQPESGGVQGRLLRLPLCRLLQPTVNVFTGLLGNGHNFPEVVQVEPLRVPPLSLESLYERENVTL